MKIGDAYCERWVATGAAYGTAKAGATIAAVGVAGPNIIMTALLPVVMAGILAIYGLVISVFISTSRRTMATGSD